MIALNNWLSGAICMAALTIALIFLRYWVHSRDRLFLYFSIAFLLEGGHRLLLAWWAGEPDSPQYYLIRLVEYGLILSAIIHKNRGNGAGGAGDS